MTYSWGTRKPKEASLLQSFKQSYNPNTEKEKRSVNMRYLKSNMLVLTQILVSKMIIYIFRTFFPNSDYWDFLSFVEYVLFIQAVFGLVGVIINEFCEWKAPKNLNDLETIKYAEIAET